MFRSRIISSVLLAATAAAMLVFSSGCLIYSRSHTTETGRVVSPNTLRQIEPGQTDEAALLALLGPPTRTTAMHDGAQLWTWERRRQRSGTAHVLFIANTHNQTEVVHSTHILLRDGIVDRVWQE